METHYSLTRAAQRIGVTRRTLYNWLRRGRLTIVRGPTGEPAVSATEVYRLKRALAKREAARI